MSQALNTLVTQLLQYGDTPYLGDNYQRLQQAIKDTTGNMVSPGLDQLGNNHTYWLALALQYVAAKASRSSLALNVLITQLLQYGDTPYLGDNYQRLQQAIAGVTGGAISPGLDQLGNNHTYWLALALQYVAAISPAPPTPGFAAKVTDWANRVVANGGPSPSNATLNAVNTWYLGMVADGLDTKMIWLTFFAPDSLTAARTPFFKTAGLDPATNNNFVAGDLTVNGLLGNAINKSLSYGINPSVSLSATNVGWSVYAPVTGSGGFTHGMSTPVVAAVSFAGAAQDNFVGTSDSFIGKTGGLTNIAVAPAGNGFYSASRTAINAHIFYFVNSTNPLSIIGSDGTNTGTGLPNSSNAMIFAQWNLQTSAVSDWSDDGYSIFAVHQALTMSQVQKFFTRCDTLRRAFGGGFV